MKHILYLLTVVLCLVGCQKKENTDHTLYQEIKSVDKMVFANMAITKTAVFENDDWYTVGKRIAAYSYDSYLRAYIDLSELQEDDLKFNDETMTVKVTLPPVITEVTGRDMVMRKEYENIGTFRKTLDSKERAQIKEKANESFTKEIVENPMFNKQLVDAAKRKARAYFEALFKANGYSASIDFKN